MTFWRGTFTILHKDLRSRAARRSQQRDRSSFALVVLLLFSFAFDPTEETTRDISGGLLWIVFAFAGALLLNRSFARELQNDCLDALVGFSAYLWRALFLRQGAGEPWHYCWPSKR